MLAWPGCYCYSVHALAIGKECQSSRQLSLCRKRGKEAKEHASEPYKHTSSEQAMQAHLLYTCAQWTIYIQYDAQQFILGKSSMSVFHSWLLMLQNPELLRGI